MASKSTAAVKPLTKTTSRTLKVAAKMASEPTPDDAPLSQQPAARKLRLATRMKI